MAWALARKQHGVISRIQLHTLGFSDDAIKHRLARGRRRQIHRGVWPEVGLALEADGGNFHRTATQQVEDRRRDQAHLRAGRTPMRVTHAQVFFEPGETIALLVDVLTALQCRRESESTTRAA